MTVQKQKKQTQVYRRADLITGQPFSAIIGGVRCNGVIHKGRTGLYLCQNQERGSSFGCANLHGYLYAYYLATNTRGELVLGARVKDLRITPLVKTKAQPKTKVAVKKVAKLPETFKGWLVKDLTDRVKIGCLMLTLEEIKGFVSVMKKVRGRTMWLTTGTYVGDNLRDAEELGEKILKAKNKQ